MTQRNPYQNNPLTGVSLKQLLEELVDHYGFEILFAYLNLNCFRTHPSIDSSVKFLKKTQWAREKVEGFYLYQYKNLPRASAAQFELSPRDRIIPEDQVPGAPAELSLEDAARLREKRERKASARRSGFSGKSARHADRPTREKIRPKADAGDAPTDQADPWSRWRDSADDS